MSSLVVWQRDNVTVEWNKQAPFTVTVVDPVSRAVYRTTHRNERSAIGVARRKHKQQQAALQWCEAQELARRFAVTLQQWLTPAEFAEMQWRNSHDPRHIGLCCASHDFCDANMAMDAAWRAMRGSTIDVDDEAQAALWNEAWDIARALYLS